MKATKYHQVMIMTKERIPEYLKGFPCMVSDIIRIQASLVQHRDFDPKCPKIKSKVTKMINLTISSIECHKKMIAMYGFDSQRPKVTLK